MKTIDLDQLAAVCGGLSRTSITPHGDSILNKFPQLTTTPRSAVQGESILNKFPQLTTTPRSAVHGGSIFDRFPQLVITPKSAVSK